VIQIDFMLLMITSGTIIGGWPGLGTISQLKRNAVGVKERNNG
jgi:hypothetical protein